MNNTHRISLLGVAVSLGLLCVPAATRGQGFYVGADAGGAIANDVNLHRFINPTPGAKVRLDPGARLSLAGGYNFNDYFSAQAETGLIYNDVKSVTGGGHIDASLSHIPLLVDLLVRYDKPNCKLVPYAGAGIGGDSSVLSLDHVRAGGAAVDGSDSALVFAWQAFAGLRYKFTDTMSIGGVYKFYYADGASWDVQHVAGDIKFGSAGVHSFGVDFNLKF